MFQGAISKSRHDFVAQKAPPAGRVGSWEERLAHETWTLQIKNL